MTKRSLSSSASSLVSLIPHVRRYRRAGGPGATVAHIGRQRVRDQALALQQRDALIGRLLRREIEIEISRLGVDERETGDVIGMRRDVSLRNQPPERVRDGWRRCPERRRRRVPAVARCG